MPISMICPSCGKRLRAQDHLAGRIASCPFCKQPVLVEPHEAEAATYLLRDDPLGTKSCPPLPDEEFDEPEIVAPRSNRSPKPVPASTMPPLATDEPPLWLRHLHWLLFLALIPLAVSLSQREDSKDFEAHLDETIKQAPLEDQIRIYKTIAAIEDGKASLDDLFAAMPGGKFVGAFLPRNSYLHWGFALMATILFMTFFLVLGSSGTAKPAHLLAVGLFTATIGIVFLLIVQWLAEASRGVWIRGGGLLAILMVILKIIGYSYRAAMDSDSNFVFSFVGYTLGVGFCEEIVKALPILALYRRGTDQSWRGAFVWGLASGAGFGIAEGIMYSGSFYNGITGPAIYAVRFISCVALHALWTGTAAIIIHRKQELLWRSMEWYEYFVPLIVFIGVPMVLHGLYDTLLKKEMNGVALAVALLSFVFLAFQISRLHSADDARATNEMLREYRRRRMT
jgi:protease PrsW